MRGWFNNIVGALLSVDSNEEWLQQMMHFLTIHIGMYTCISSKTWTKGDLMNLLGAISHVLFFRFSTSLCSKREARTLQRTFRTEISWCGGKNGMSGMWLSDAQWAVGGWTFLAIVYDETCQALLWKFCAPCFQWRKYPETRVNL